MKRTEKKRKQKKAVLVATLATAAVIVGGMTFAWYTSKDEVTNRLSASTDYGVSIVEDFTPETEWLPGQNVKKVAGAVNTGTVDAFVRMWLTGEMKLVKEDAGVSVNAFKALTLNPVEDATFTKVGLTKMSTEGSVNTYYKVLNNTAKTDGQSERVSLQTGELIHAGGNYTFKSNQGDGTTVINGTSFDGDGTKVELVDSESFTPTESGLFIFRRNYDLGTDGNVNKNNIEYSGYYYDGSDTYYALKTKNDGTVGNGVTGKASNVYIPGLTGLTGDEFKTAIGQVKVFSAKETTLHNDNFTWTYNEPSTAANSPFGTINPYFEIKQNDPADSTLKINVELQNIGDGTAADKWQPINDNNGKYTFYYTNDLESGTASNALVNAVQLDKGATQNDFIAFDFDLNVNLESVQVTKDQSGKESATPVAPTTGWVVDASENSNITAASGTATMDNAEIAKMTWAKM